MTGARYDVNDDNSLFLQDSDAINSNHALVLIYHELYIWSRVKLSAKLNLDFLHVSTQLVYL